MPPRDDFDMPLFPQFYAESLAYVYASKADAKQDEGFLSVGFFVSVPSKRLAAHHYHYIVTNAHVVKDLDPVVLRFNTHTGCKAVSLPKSKFAVSEILDLAVAYVNLPHAKYTFVTEPTFVGLEEFRNLGIGLGDDVVMISRIQRDSMRYTARNHSAMRFGNISLLPQGEETFYMVEMRSVSGHSGSPVLVYEGPEIFEGLRKPAQSFLPMLLGINRGHLCDYERIVKITRQGRIPHPHYVTEVNTAISQIVPAWYISHMLHLPRFERQRKALETKLDHRMDIRLDSPTDLERGSNLVDLINRGLDAKTNN